MFGLEEIENKHNEKFGVEPKVIGFYWDDIDKLVSEIKKSIKENVPYDEYDTLTDEDKKLYDSGELVF